MIVEIWASLKSLPDGKVAGAVALRIFMVLDPYYFHVVAGWGSSTCKGSGDGYGSRVC